MPRLVALLVLAGVAVSALRPRRVDPVHLAMIEREGATVH